jgi:predicted ribosomally synthesized peptide with SipW-like signal peptide
VAVAVLATVAGTGGTYALWNAAAETDGATIRSGTASVIVSPMTSTRAPVLAPGASTTGTFTARNTGSVPLSMRVTTTSTKVSYVDVPDSTVLGVQTLRLSAVRDAAACRPGNGGASGALATFDTGTGYFTLPVGVTATACVEIVLASDAPQSVSGAVTDFTLTVTGTQVTS